MSCRRHRLLLLLLLLPLLQLLLQPPPLPPPPPPPPLCFNCVTHSLTRSLAGSHNCTASRYFVRVMEKVLEKGNAHVVNEILRLGRLMEQDSVSTEKKAGFKKRLKVLARFRVRGL